MIKLYPHTKQAAQKLVAYLINGDCAFALSCDMGQAEIRGYWSCAVTESLIVGAGLTTADFDIE